MVKQQLARAEGRLESSRAKIRDLEASLAALEVRARDAKTTEQRCLDFVQEYEILCRSLGLQVPAGQELVADLRRQAEQHRDALIPVLQHSEDYARAAQVEIHQERKAALQARLAGIHEEAAQLQEAEQRLRTWIDTLGAAAVDAVRARVGKFRKDINSLFRAMVACPEKFDSVVVSDTTVQLGIAYHDDASGLPAQPRYFLSSAELNALGLSVFLALASSQRCFRLHSILLDDPVQHLDDLDTVAFLDTVRSIAVAPGTRRRQVLLSTCDQELYRLIVRKFSLLNREKKGTFTAIAFSEAADDIPARYDVGGPAGASLIPQPAA